MSRPPYFLVFLLGSTLLAVMVACGVSGGGSVPPLPSDFEIGAGIPGWVLLPATGSRGDVTALSAHDGARWSVILSKAATPIPRDTGFALAVSDDGLGHAGVPLVRLTFRPGAQPSPELVAARPVANGQVVPDGMLSPGEWDPSSFSLLQATPQNELPAGTWPPLPNNAFITAGAAYDADHVYLVFQWLDESTTRSDLGPLLQWDGSAWIARPHRSNDIDGNGVLGPGEPPMFAATAEDQDRLMLMLPLRDQAASFEPGGTGCAASCHMNLQLDPNGAEALHGALCPGDRGDVWTWRAASTDPGRRADDGFLDHGSPALGRTGGGSGLAADAGGAPFVAQDPTAPPHMFAMSPGGQTPLFAEMLAFAAGTLPGYPILPAIAANAAPYDPADFNMTGLPPQTWSGTPPFFGDDHLPPFVMVEPTGSRADLEVGSSYSGGLWTVEFRRRRVTRDASGAPREDDFQFEEDADFRRKGILATLASDGLPFSLSVVDDGAGHDLGETRFAGPLLLSSDPTLAGGVHQAHLYVHDYGPAWTAASQADFTDATETQPVPDAGANPSLRLKAGTDGGQNIRVLAVWDDPGESRDRDRWSWDGFGWERAGGQDELRIVWNLAVPRETFVSGGGCAHLCHGSSVGAPGLEFSAPGPNESVDLWHWQAGRTAPLERADDGFVDDRLFATILGAAPGAASHGDTGSPPFSENVFVGQPFPARMAPADPNANAAALTLGVSGMPDSIPFVDMAAGLPPKPPGGGGVSFSSEVLPIFLARCTTCHGGAAPQSGLSLESWQELVAGSNNGPVVIPGSPSTSELILRITGQSTPQMPLGAPALSQAQIDLISAWIAEGALNN